MTAEIVVRNREAVILAADSAVSSRVGSIVKTSTSANKIFILSNNHPVGIMIYGNDSFMGLPWETLIKYYRNNILPSTGFDTLNEYANNFIQSLNSKYINFLSYAELEYVVSFASSLFHNIFYTITQEIGRLIANGQELTDKKIHGLCDEVLSEYFDRYKKLNKVLNINDSRLVLNKYKKAIEQVRNAVFKKLGLPSELHKKNHRYYGLWFCKRFYRKC